jgi:hypothetical protein
VLVQLLSVRYEQILKGNKLMTRITHKDLPKYLADHCRFQQEPVIVQQNNGLWQLAFQLVDVGLPFHKYLAVVETQSEIASRSMNHWMSILQQSGVYCVKLDLRKGANNESC